MASITRGSQASTNGKRGKTQYGDQSPILTVFGEPPQVIRVTAEQHLPLAQALVEKLGRMMVVVDHPPRTILASPSNGVVHPGMMMPAMTPAGGQAPQGPILQADQLPPARNSATTPRAAAGKCIRCDGTGQTTRGACPVCGGKGVAR
jgi:hypothetical protein